MDKQCLIDYCVCVCVHPSSFLAICFVTFHVKRAGFLCFLKYFLDIITSLKLISVPEN